MKWNYAKYQSLTKVGINRQFGFLDQKIILLKKSDTVNKILDIVGNFKIFLTAIKSLDGLDTMSKKFKLFFSPNFLHFRLIYTNISFGFYKKMSEILYLKVS